MGHDQSTLSYEFRAAVVAGDENTLVLDPPIIEDDVSDEDGEADEDDD